MIAEFLQKYGYMTTDELKAAERSLAESIRKAKTRDDMHEIMMEVAFVGGMILGRTHNQKYW